MPGADRLANLARGFATKIQDLLNATICDGVTVAAVISADPNRVHVGHGLAKRRLVTERFPVRIRRKPTCWLDVGYRLCLDEESQYLTVVSSFFGVYASHTGPCLCHFDYERDKTGGYPEAHLQVPGQSEALAAMSSNPAKRSLERLHFPVGGRRFRPILEDVIEFLIVEQLAKPREEAWKDILDREREEYYRIQLQAAIRRSPEIARDALAGLNAPLVPPQRGKSRLKVRRSGA